ncbi:MAG: hypothetical protein ABSF83_03495 [Nitrososphaerales archaeon]|jgi:hypothetical protein
MAAAPAGERRSEAALEAEEDEEELASSGVAASLLVGWAMVGVYLASSVMQVYEKMLLSSTFFNPSSQFAYLGVLSGSPAAYDLIDWQNIVLFEAVPFLLFFYLAVRMRIGTSGKLWPTVVAAAAVGAALSVLSSLLDAYQANISHLLLSGSFAIPGTFDVSGSAQSGSSIILSILSTPWIVLENGAIFAALALTGLAFGSFAGETPYGIFRSAFDSFMEGRDGGENAIEGDDPEAVGATVSGRRTDSDNQPVRLLSS